MIEISFLSFDTAFLHGCNKQLHGKHNGKHFVGHCFQNREWQAPFAFANSCLVIFSISTDEAFIVFSYPYKFLE